MAQDNTPSPEDIQNFPTSYQTQKQYFRQFFVISGVLIIAALIGGFFLGQSVTTKAMHGEMSRLAESHRIIDKYNEARVMSLSEKLGEWKKKYFSLNAEMEHIKKIYNIPAAADAPEEMKESKQ